MFPSLTWDGIRSRARIYKVTPHLEEYSETQDNFIRKHYPDYKKMMKEYPNRTLEGLKKRAIRLGLTQSYKMWTAEEDAFLYKGQKPPGRSMTSCSQRRIKLGMRGSFIDAVLKLSGDELSALVMGTIPKGYPDQVKNDAAQILTELCLRGKCHPSPGPLAAAAKKAISEVYKLHPDRGAPVSMDAKLFDDGEATVGDRIASDAFHF